MTLTEFYDELDKHDWYYDWSDDGRVWDRGHANLSRLLNIAGESKAHQLLYDAFHAHHFSGAPWKTDKKPKPERPETEAIQC